MTSSVRKGHQPPQIKKREKVLGTRSKGHITKGWDKAGITKLVKGKPSVPPEDSFEDIDGAIQI